MIDHEKQLLVFNNWDEFPRPCHANTERIYYDLATHYIYRFDGASYLLVDRQQAVCFNYIAEKIRQCGDRIEDAIAETVVEASASHGDAARQAIFGAPDIWLGMRLSVRKIVRAFRWYEQFAKDNTIECEYANVWIAPQKH